MTVVPRGWSGTSVEVRPGGFDEVTGADVRDADWPPGSVDRIRVRLPSWAVWRSDAAAALAARLHGRCSSWVIDYRDAAALAETVQWHLDRYSDGAT